MLYDWVFHVDFGIFAAREKTIFLIGKQLTRIKVIAVQNHVPTLENQLCSNRECFLHYGPSVVL